MEIQQLKLGYLTLLVVLVLVLTLNQKLVRSVALPQAPAATTGAFGASPTGVGSAGNEPGAGRWIGYLDGVNINASRSSSLYGASSTVQPPAYVVNVWRRTA